MPLAGRASPRESRNNQGCCSHQDYHYPPRGRDTLSLSCGERSGSLSDIIALSRGHETFLRSILCIKVDISAANGVTSTPTQHAKVSHAFVRACTEDACGGAMCVSSVYACRVEDICGKWWPVGLSVGLLPRLAPNDRATCILPSTALLQLIWRSPYRERPI